MSDLPPEIVGEIANASVALHRVPRRPEETAPRLSTDQRRRHVLARNKEQIQQLEPLVAVGGAYGAAVKRSPVWQEVADEYGACSVGGGDARIDWSDMLLEFNALQDEFAAAGMHLEPIKGCN
jgi:hypothetical protein